MRIIFAGTPEFTLPVLDSIARSNHTLVTVYTQPDRIAGRGRKVKPSAVKTYAMEHHLAYRQPLHWDQNEYDFLASIQADLIVVMAYGMLLPDMALAAPTLACVNLHTSLLPRWRGAAPVARAIEAGDTETGISLMRMAETLDTGPVISQKTLAVSTQDTCESLYPKLADTARLLLKDFLADAENMLAHATPQAEKPAHYAPKLSKSEARIDWDNPATVIDRKIRACIPWPVAQTCYQSQVLRLWEAQPVQQITRNPATVGEIISASPQDGLIVQCGKDALNILQIQIAGRKIMPVKTFLNGYAIQTGSILQ